MHCSFALCTNVGENFPSHPLALCDGDQDEIERFAPLKRIDCSVTTLLGLSSLQGTIDSNILLF